MKVKGTMNADVVGFSIKRNQAHTGKEANVDLEIGFKREEAERRIGEDFVALAFSTMRVVEGEDDEGDSVKSLVDRIKPGKNCSLERHRIVIITDPEKETETEIEMQPELISIVPVEGEEKVLARFRIPIDVSKASVINALTKLVGDTVKVRWNPQQGTLDFDKAGASRNGNGHEEDDGEEAGDSVDSEVAEASAQ